MTKDHEPIGPLTDATFPRGKRGAKGTPILDEWIRHLDEHGGLALLWAGAEVRRGADDNFSWCWFAMHRNEAADQEPATCQQEAGATAEDVAIKTERLLAPLAHAARIRLMLALTAGPLAAAQLSERSGLKGGNLYHHLRDLIHNTYVRDHADRTYELSSLGRQMLLTLTRIATYVVKDRQEDGLAITDHD